MWQISRTRYVHLEGLWMPDYAICKNGQVPNRQNWADVEFFLNLNIQILI